MKGKVGEFSITLIKSNDAPDDAKFLVREVSVKGKIVWHFRDEKFDGLALLADPKGIPCICLVSKRGELKKIIPINSLLEKAKQEEKAKELFEFAKEKIELLLK